MAGCGKACEIAELHANDNHQKLAKVKAMFVELITNSGLDYSFNGDQANCLDNTINISLHGVSSEALMISTKKYCGISNGSACTSKSYSPSYVLAAMGLPIERIESSIRISWGPETNLEQLGVEFKELLSAAKNLVQ